MVKAHSTIRIGRLVNPMTTMGQEANNTSELTGEELGMTKAACETSRVLWSSLLYPSLLS